LAPLFAIPTIDQRAIVMVVLALPIMVIITLLSTKWFERSSSKGETR
jgi:hypothetical protein